MDICPSEKVYKPASVHFCTDFTSTANATVSTYGRDIPRGGTLLQAAKVVQGSHLLNIYPYPQPTRATLPNRHLFSGKYSDTFLITSIGLYSKYSHLDDIYSINPTIFNVLQLRETIDTYILRCKLPFLDVTDPIKRQNPA
ncbi:hypothetical protein RF11_02037 [Thelohanellus kitauei]|uniref:Uncharacterized protein n=1 Tax=Thelohanellus kitauei TaxID=669202 RepID=A0A0C2IRH4_THEKT|nr:hypothetical protein RF11_02037 [Thelohanellus kitauei]